MIARMGRRWWLLSAGLLAQCGTKTRPPPAPSVDLTPDAGPALAAAPCTFSGVVCDGQTPYRCASESAREYLPSCVGARPFCVAGGCVACPPAAVRCDPDRPAQPQRCADDGSGWAAAAACDASAGERCTDGRCGDPCAVPEGARGYLGCEYWATQTPNSQLDLAFEFAVALANPQSFEVTVRISGGALSEPVAEVLAPGAVRAVPLPWVLGLVQGSPDNHGCLPNTRCAGWPPARTAVVRRGAYHIESTAPVAAYQFNPLNFEREGGVSSFTNDASLLLSQRSLTRSYLVLTAPNWAFSSELALGGFIAVTAVSGETTSVNIQLPARAGVRGETGTVTQENLTPGDVFVLVGDEAGDLSGALVEASGPVAVFAGHDCTNVPQSRVACDHLEEQVPPLETLGRDFVVAPLIDRPGLASVVRVVSPFDGAELRFDPPSVQRSVRLAQREVLQFQTASAFHMTSTRPVLVAQFMEGQGTPVPGARVGAGDPAMVYEVPTQQFRDRYDLLVPDTYTSNFLGVVVPHGASALLDGDALTPARTILGAWDLLSVPVAPGAHRLLTAEGVPLGVKVYGTARYTSYMYPGGLDLQLLPPG
jgi:hypothetical protein